jgi:hypothetical protein
MSEYWAQLDENNTVIQVMVVTKEYMTQYPNAYPGVWVQTFFDHPDKVYAGLGFTYNAETEDFIKPTMYEYPRVPIN